ncbi:acyl carrier protein [Cellvibrio mixtus]|uniref:acyl carrier protein n=1 Tax=Cellvibrio mixtus TaxID=39650 RepID=UPI000586A2A9|nr:acyl carrier protein [Cellvibrio mixtus]
MSDLLIDTPAPGAEAIQNWLYDYIENVLDFNKADIVSDVPLQNLGLDSSSAVGLISDLAAWSGVPLGVKVLRTHNSIKSLAEYVARNH